MNEFLETPVTPFVRYIIAFLAICVLIVIILSVEHLNKSRNDH